MSKAKVYQQVTDRIVSGLKEKGLKWFRPWNAGAENIELPINNSTGKSYTGLNVLFLSIEQMFQGYETSEWLTYKQAAAKGGQVNKGESGTQIVFWSITFKAIGEDGKPVFYRQLSKVPRNLEYQTLFTPRVWTVFNIAQCSDIEPITKRVEAEGSFSPIDRAEKVLAEQYPKDKIPSIAHGGGSAFYSPSRHHVQMPKPQTFVTNDDYYKTLFHELVHSTGHKTCLNRKEVASNSGFGSEDYSKEELVAEIGSQFLVSMTGIQPKDDHTNSQAYINNWISKLENDPSLAMTAATQAMKAVDFITGG